MPHTDDGAPIPQRLRIAELGLVVHTVLARHPELHYYQGFHDVCAVLLNVLEDRALAAALAEQVATRWLRLAMAPTLQPVLAHLGRIWTLVAREDAALYEFLDRYAPPAAAPACPRPAPPLIRRRRRPRTVWRAGRRCPPTLRSAGT